MKHDRYYLLLVLLIGVTGICDAQHHAAPDTLIVEHVIGDPTIDMLTAPSGNDDKWVNFDADFLEGLCVTGGEETPMGWFSEIDLGFLNPLSTDNYAFTSCSYLITTDRNQNWLILPPVMIPDDQYLLCWRSLTYEGPAFTDGYRVLASTNSNLPDDFTIELFRAAEMIKPIVNGQFTLDPSDYVFSDGYIHANGFTDTNYFFLNPPNGPYRGRLEPHTVSLAQFAGQSIYLAFLHDSQDDSQLQLDDIVVAKDLSSRATTAGDLSRLSLAPNPAQGYTYLQWHMNKPLPGTVRLLDQQGRLVQEKSIAAYTQGQLMLDLQQVPVGLYQVVLQTAQGWAATKLVRQ